MKTTRPILFLDFDGVLNSHDWFVQTRGGPVRTEFEVHEHSQIDPANVAHLNRIIETTGCEVVISSTWRRGRTVGALLRLLVARGLEKKHWDSFVGTTPVLDGRLVSGPYTAKERGHEIQAWLDEHRHDECCIVILDDDSDMAHLMSRLVLTSPMHGLDAATADRAIALLTTQDTDPSKL